MGRTTLGVPLTKLNMLSPSGKRQNGPLCSGKTNALTRILRGGRKLQGLELVAPHGSK